MADGSAKLSGRDYEFQEPTLRRESTVKRESQRRISRRQGREFQPEETKDDEEIHKDMGTSFIVIILNREFNYTCREKNHFLFHWNTLISSGQTHTDLDVAQEKRIDDYCNVDGNRNLSDSWTGFTRFTLLNETPPRGCMWYGEWLTKSLRHLAQIIYGLTLRQGLEKSLKEKKNKNGQLRNQNSNMPENWEILILLIQAMKSTRTSLKKK